MKRPVRGPVHLLTGLLRCASVWQRSDVAQRRVLPAVAVDRIWVTRAEGRGYRFDAVERLRIAWAPDILPG